MYKLLQSIHFPNGEISLNLLSSHKVIIDFFHVLHAYIVVWCLLGQLKSCIRFKVVSVSAADLWIWLPWWLHMLLIKKIPLDTQQQFMDRSSEMVNLSFNTRCDMMQALYMQCVDKSVPRREMWIWLADMNLHTSHIQDSFCNHWIYAPLVPLQVGEWIGWH